MGLLKHIGAEAFNAQRNELLAEYEIEKCKAADDPVKVGHGVVGESVLRKWLGQFLPKKFGVTKGYIITHNLEYEGTLEEWDLIIYDRLEAPVLYVRGSPDMTSTGARMAIPVEHVRGVIEVKATFRPDMARKMQRKLEKLRHFVGIDETEEYPKFLRPPFVCSGIFFETDVRDYAEFRSALNELTPLALAGPMPSGFLILSSQTFPDHCAYLRYYRADAPMNRGPEFEVSDDFAYPDDKFGVLGCLGGWGRNHFSSYVFDLLSDLSGNRKAGKISSFYGIDFELTQGSRLFQRGHNATASEQ